MSAFETYFMRYELDMETGSVRELPERQESVSFDPYSLAEEHLSSDFFWLSVEAMDERQFEIRESVSNEQAVITTVDEAIEFSLSLEDMISDWTMQELDMSRPTNMCGASSASNDELMAEYCEVLRELLTVKAKEAWNRRELFEPD